MNAVSNYDKFPTVDVPGTNGQACRGWDAAADRLRAACDGKSVLAIECYSGVFVQEIVDALQPVFAGATFVNAADAMLSAAEIDHVVAPYLGGDDPVFGVMSRLTLAEYFDPKKLARLRRDCAGKSSTASTALTIVFGVGASLVAPDADVLVYADMPRWEEQLRQRRNEVSNLGVQNRELKASLQYKRSYFIDWRACDRQKRATMNRWDFLLDTTVPGDPKLVSGDALRAGLRECTRRPFRVVPFFDAGPWGGQWMKEKFALDPSSPNFAWGFDCVPEENSLLLRFGDVRVELPSIDLVFAEPRALLGYPVYGRFGAEFPIRFDFLDTMEGGNLSFQVHPLTHYAYDQFGLPYTQDESYYILDASPGAHVYLGRKHDAEFNEMIDSLRAAHAGGEPFEASRFVAELPAKKHDHFLIPAGTLHCSGKNSVVLEISATPYIFTFKLWDWGRMGLDGKPRPINIEHGRKNIQWERDESYARTHLANRLESIAAGDGWREERTGLHDAEFIETRRHWFTGTVPHDTGGERAGGVHVLNLVEGEEAIVESPTGAFEPYAVHYAETWIVPAAVGTYTVRPHGPSVGKECATMKAFVRSRA